MIDKDHPPLHQLERISRVKNRMRESRSSGSVGGEGGNLLAYPATRRGHRVQRWPDLPPGPRDESFQKALSKIRLIRVRQFVDSFAASSDWPRVRQTRFALNAGNRPQVLKDGT